VSRVPRSELLSISLSGGCFGVAGGDALPPASGGRVFCTQDGWSSFREGKIETAQVVGSVVALGDDLAVAAGQTTDGSTAVWRLDNSNCQWHPADGSNVPNARLFSVAFSNKVDGWAGGDFIFLTTMDGGRTWHRGELPSPTLIRAVATRAGTSQVFVAGSSVQRQAIIYRSDNAGRTWTATSPPVAGVASVLSLSASNGTVLAGGSSSSNTSPAFLLWSSDDGSSWHPATAPAVSAVSSIATQGDQAAIAIATDLSGQEVVLTSKDAGRHWTVAQTGPLIPPGAAGSSDGTAWVTADDRVLTCGC